MTYPLDRTTIPQLRAVVSREVVGNAVSETLECGHVQYTRTYMPQAKARRCTECVEMPRWQWQRTA